jgi:hypothetical protein
MGLKLLAQAAELQAPVRQHGSTCPFSSPPDQAFTLPRISTASEIRGGSAPAIAEDLARTRHLRRAWFLRYLVLREGITSNGDLLTF